MFSDRLLAIIGLDENLVERLRPKIAASEGCDPRFVIYPDLPKLYSMDGVIHVESPKVKGRWLQPDGVLFYSYFENAEEIRRSLALSNTPTFPNVEFTLPLDDKTLALVLATRLHDHNTRRGYVPAGQEVEIDGERVIKWGNAHCGEGKKRVRGPFRPSESVIVEPFLEGTSERILIVGDQEWQLHYESTDWRKNVNATVTQVPPNLHLVTRAREIASGLGLKIAGVDFLLHEQGNTLLEVNAYPGLDDVPEAEETFLDLVVQWWG